MGTYVVGDIHGCYDEWIQLKDRIETSDPEAMFILVGDIVDRGHQVMEMIDWAMENITPDGKYQMVLGNHENEKIEWWEDYLSYREDEGLGINNTIDYTDISPDNYDFQFNMSYHNKKDADVHEIIQFFKSLPLYKELFIETEGRKRGKQHYIVVHAAMPWKCINKDETVKKKSLTIPKKYHAMVYLIEKNREAVIWDRNYYGNAFLKNTIVVHGHTPTFRDCYRGMQMNEGVAYFSHCDINIDCGLTFKREFYNNLCAIRLEDLQEFYLYDKPYKLFKHQKEAREQMKAQIAGKRKSKTDNETDSETDDSFFNTLDDLFN